MSICSFTVNTASPVLLKLTNAYDLWGFVTITYWANRLHPQQLPLDTIAAISNDQILRAVVTAYYIFLTFSAISSAFARLFFVSLTITTRHVCRSSLQNSTHDFTDPTQQKPTRPFGICTQVGPKEPCIRLRPGSSKGKGQFLGPLRRGLWSKLFHHLLFSHVSTFITFLIKNFATVFTTIHSRVCRGAVWAAVSACLYARLSCRHCQALAHGRPHIGANGVSWPPGKMDEKLKSENTQKERFSTLYFESNRGRQV